MQGYRYKVGFISISLEFLFCETLYLMITLYLYHLHMYVYLDKVVWRREIFFNLQVGPSRFFVFVLVLTYHNCILLKARNCLSFFGITFRLNHSKSMFPLV